MLYLSSQALISDYTGFGMQIWIIVVSYSKMIMARVP